MSRILVLGAGVSGLAAGRLARRRGIRVAMYDENPRTRAIEEGFGIATGRWDSGLLSGVDYVVASPGFSERSLPVVESLEHGIPVLSEVEFAWRSLTSPVAAVTGTNGKTSVTEATSAMLEASGLDAPATGNIGAPLSDFTDRSYDVLVVEVSSFQLRFTEQFHPHGAGITNVASDHLDWHGSDQSYRSAKARIYANQTAEDFLVYDCDDEGASKLASSAPSRLIPVSGTSLPQGGAGVVDGRLVVEEIAMDVGDLASDDPTHLVNLAMAASVALRMGATPDGIETAAIRYLPGAHRRSLVAEVGGVRWINDSKATNPHAALASIAAQGPVILIAGGRDKGLDLSPLPAEPNVKMVIGIGESGPELVEHAGERGRLAGTLDIAVEMAAQTAAPGDTVLLAPGCASFDQFGSYQERGMRFEELVEERLGGGSP